jgi:hypothetical protein
MSGAPLYYLLVTHHKPGPHLRHSPEVNGCIA